MAQERGEPMLQTTLHRFWLLAKSVAIGEATQYAPLDNDEIEQSGYISTFLQPREALLQAEFVLAHREQLEELQKELDATWEQVARQVALFLESRQPGSFISASPGEIQQALEELSDQTMHRGPASYAGLWYTSLSGEKGKYPATYKQQWKPFLMVCRQMQVQETN